MQVRDGPAAVRGDARRGNATGRKAGKAAKGEPRVRRPAALPDPNPSRKEDSCFAELIVLSVLLARARSRLRPWRPTSRSASKARRPRSSDPTPAYGRPPTTRSRRSTSPARPASSITRMTTSSFGDYVSQIGKYPAVGLGGLGVQGQRRLAARRRRQGDAEGRRRRALVLRDVRHRPAGRRRSS